MNGPWSMAILNYQRVLILHSITCGYSTVRYRIHGPFTDDIPSYEPPLILFCSIDMSDNQRVYHHLSFWVNFISTEACSPEPWNYGEW